MSLASRTAFVLSYLMLAGELATPLAVWAARTQDRSIAAGWCKPCDAARSAGSSLATVAHRTSRPL
jgi:hypothetical protein